MERSLGLEDSFTTETQSHRKTLILIFICEIHSHNSLAVLGLLALLGATSFLAERCFSDWFTRGDKTIQQALVNSDGSAKATLYRIDFGAAAATRTYIRSAIQSKSGRIE